MFIDHVAKKIDEGKEDLFRVQISSSAMIVTRADNVCQSASIDHFPRGPDICVEAVYQLSYVHCHPPHFTEDSKSRNVRIRNCTVELP